MDDIVFRVLEFLGMVFSIYGSYMISRDEKIFTRTVYIGYISFFVSNIMILLVAINALVMPLVVQAILFFIGSILVVLSRSNNIQRDRKIFIYILIPYSFVIAAVLHYTSQNAVFTIVMFEVIAAAMAITGNFLFASKKDKFKVSAYLLYLVADAFYISIAFEHDLYFFMIQSAFFVYTSSKGLYNVLKYKKTGALVPA